MDLRIRPLREDDVEAVVQLSLAAWVPVFCSFERMLGPAFPLLYPDWRGSQREAIEKVCRERDHKIVYVAELGGAVAGFVAYELNAETRTGTVEYLAVDPEHQNRGIGTALNRFVLEKMREAGMQLAVVGTGGDPGHAPARWSYEKAGYTAFPQVWYYKTL